MRSRLWSWSVVLLVAACHEKNVTPGASPSGAGSTSAVGESESDEAEADDGEGDDALPALPMPAGPPSRAHFLEEVRRVMGAAKSTRYSHVSEVDEAKGLFALDCSGFVDYALSRSAPTALAALPRSPPKHLRPRAEDFVKGFTAGASPWTRVVHVKELEAGDVVAWLRPRDSKSKNTGHVMVVNGAPRSLGASEWAVPIIDSTALRHGASDSRAPTKATGVGQGTIVLVADAADAPISFRWSTHGRVHTTNIELGRLVP